MSGVRLMVAIHATRGDDGCEPILAHLARKYDLLARNARPDGNLAGIVARYRAKEIPITVVIEGPNPMTAAQVVAKCGLPPIWVTNVLLLLDARVVSSDPNGAILKALIEINGVSGIALGAIGEFDPDSAGLDDPNRLSDRTNRLVSYVHTVLKVPVVYLSTGDGQIIDLEPMPLHELPA
jgi:hypothetical protein